MSPSRADVAEARLGPVGAVTDEAFECALRALEHRDRTQLGIDALLQERGFSDDDRARALEALLRTGLVDDERFAHARASSLASRGAGNALIRARLFAAGVASELADAAIGAVESEDVRAGRIVASRGASPKTARYLYAKGFSEDAVGAAIAVGDDGELR